MPSTPLTWLPFLRWFPPSVPQLKADTVAGLTVGLMAVPQAMAYAQLAGMPPVYGIYAAIVPCIIAAAFGWCHQLSTGPVAMTSLLTASVLAPLAVPGSAEWIALAALLCLLVGLVRLAAGLLRAGVLAALISHPVMLGFSAAGGLVIALSQLPVLLGIPGMRSVSFLGDEWHVLMRLGELHGPTVVVGAAALAAILLLRPYRQVPGTLLVLVGATVASWAVGYGAGGGAIVGEVPIGLPAFAAPAWDWAQVKALLPGAGMVAMIGFLEVYAVAKACATRTRQQLRLDQELVGQGAGAVAGAFTQGFPVSGSLSRSVVNLHAGAVSGFSSLVCAAVAVAALFVTPLIHHLPIAALGAAIVAAALSLIDLPAIRRAWRANHHDGLAIAVTFTATLALAPSLAAGVLFGVALTFVLFVRRSMEPRMAILGPSPDGTWRDAERWGLHVRDDIAVLRFDGRLSFINAGFFEDSVRALLRERPSLKAVVVSGDGLNEIDATGEEMLRRLHRDLSVTGIGLSFATLKAQVVEVFDATGFTAVLGAGNIHRTPEAAIAAFDAGDHEPQEP